MQKLIPCSVLLFSLIMAIACHKNTAPSEVVLTQEQKYALIEKVRADTLYKQWQSVMKQGFAILNEAGKSGKIDTVKMKVIQPTGSRDEHIKKMEDAGMYNAREFFDVNNRALELLKMIDNKYPQLDQLTFQEKRLLYKKSSPKP